MSGFIAVTLHGDQYRATAKETHGSIWVNVESRPYWSDEWVSVCAIFADTTADAEAIAAGFNATKGRS